MPGIDLQVEGLASARMVSYGEPLPSSGGDARRQSGGWDALVAEHVCEPVQPVPWRAGACFSGALQGDPA